MDPLAEAERYLERRRRERSLSEQEIAGLRLYLTPEYNWTMQKTEAEDLIAEEENHLREIDEDIATIEGLLAHIRGD